MDVGLQDIDKNSFPMQITIHFSKD
jgi:hypothetical protein